MTNNKKFFSLNVQLSMAVILGILLAAVMYVCCSGVGQYIVNIRFLSDSAVEKNVGAAYESLQKYIIQRDVKGTDNEELSDWLKQNHHTYLYIYDNYGSAFEAGWSAETHSDISNIENHDSIKETGNLPRIDKKNFNGDTKNRIIEFADQEYYVFLDIYEEEVWYQIIQIVTIVACFLTLLATLLVYNATVLRRIKHFSEEVQTVADGNLDGEIHNIHNDEIGRLAVSVDNMRDSIVQKHESERMAWEANQELITAMSHDIRSPLTSIIGYLDIINDKKDENPEELDKYIDACRSKAFQLKELSDKLFQYFLVFGNRKEDIELETLDASLLFQQILGEHSAEIISYGYTVNMEYNLESGNMQTDISGIRRLFNNIFQNIIKYADIEKPVNIKVNSSENKVKISVMNFIPEVAKKVESTRIGIKTCKRISENMNGSFEYEEADNTFTVFVEFPLECCETEEEEDK